VRFSYLVTVTTNREQQKKLNIVSTYKRGIGIAFFVYYKVKIMDIKTTVQRYLINKPATLVDFPFDSVTEVYKVKGKMFALLGKDKSKHVEHEQASNNLIPYRLNLKCDPDEAQILRDIFPAITAGYHMNKKHWNTIILNGSVPQGEVERMIDNSFKLVVSKMAKKDQASVLVHL